MIGILIGILLISIGFALLLLPEEDQTHEEGIRGGAVVMVGPIPIVIGSDTRSALILMCMAAAMMILWLYAMKVGL